MIVQAPGAAVKRFCGSRSSLNRSFGRGAGVEQNTSAPDFLCNRRPVIGRIIRARHYRINGSAKERAY
jgi:hypothetical protein